MEVFEIVKLIRSIRVALFRGYKVGFFRDSFRYSFLKLI